MRTHYAIAALLLGTSLAGCSSIIEGTSQQIVLNTNPPGADCSFNREGIVIGRVNPTPGAVTIKKDKHDITIACNKAGYQETTYLNHSGVAGATFGNIVLGGGVGWAIDSASGADNKYDSPVNLTLTPGSASQTSSDVGPEVRPAEQAARLSFGITGSRVTPDSTAAATLGQNPYGAFVSAVSPQSPAAKAGIKPGDVIQSFNGLKVETVDDVNVYASKTAVGATVKLGIVRRGEIRSIEVTL